MIQTDKRAFTASFHRLWSALKHERLSPQEQAAKQIVYWDSLMCLPIEAIVLAERLLRQPGASAWFPTTTEWGDKASDCEITLLEQHVASLALPPSPAAKAAEMERAEAGRAAFIEACRSMGHHWLAEYAAAIVLHHPSDSTRPVFCQTCLDGGLVALERAGVRVAVPCACEVANPIIKRRNVLARRLQLMGSRTLGA